MKKVVKITDVAERAGVVKSTVSNVLTGKKFVSEELRKKVLDACEELDFHPNFYASALSGHKSDIVALLLESSDEVDRKIYQKVIMGCLKQSSKSGYSLLIYYNLDKEMLLNTLRRGIAPIDGAIIMTPCVNDERLLQIESGRINCVVIGRPENDNGVSFVDIDNIALVKNVSEKLIGGYGKEIYLINSDRDMTISRDREAAFSEICGKYGIDARMRIFESKNQSEEEGYEIARKILKKGASYITANGKLAAGVYRAAAEAGLEIGEDVGVFALGRSLDHGMFTPKLAYADQDYDLLGKKAVETLIDEIDNGFGRKRLFVESKIIFADSVKKISN